MNNKWIKSAITQKLVANAKKKTRHIQYGTFIGHGDGSAFAIIEPKIVTIMVPSIQLIPIGKNVVLILRVKARRSVKSCNTITLFEDRITLSFPVRSINSYFY